MARLIDSSVFIDLERRRQPVRALALRFSEPVAIAAVTASELLVGVHRAKSSQQRSRRESFVRSVFSAFQVLPFDLAVAHTHAGLVARAMAAGRPVGAHDLLIAATALTHGYSILTHNLRDFQRVPGLVVEQPTW